ncbi:unnamed protein product [Closterium sp. Naga37s-1]|nr:unnamed protein product [Closterium sp. Naga37s-1]
MATLRTVFILALVLVSLPALYAASAPMRGGVATAGSAGVDAASWGRKLLDQQGGEEEEVGEMTEDGLDEAVRVLLSWKKFKNAVNQAAKSEAGQKAGGLVKNVVKKGGKEALTAAVNAFRSGKGAKGALQAHAPCLTHFSCMFFPQYIPLMPYLPSHPLFPPPQPLLVSHWKGVIHPVESLATPLHPCVRPCPSTPQAAPFSDGWVSAGQPSNPVNHWSGGVNLLEDPFTALHPCIRPRLSTFPTAAASEDLAPAGQLSEPLGVNLWMAPAVKQGDILVVQWFTETHDVQRFKNIFASKACSFFSAMPLTSASQFESIAAVTMATLRTVFILALVLATLPALYAAAAPKQRGDVAGGSAAVDAASWGRKLLEASGGNLDVGGEEEEVGEATDGLDEAVRVLLSWKKIKNAANQAAKSEAGQKAGGLVKNVVKKGGKEALMAAVNAYRSGKGAKGALQAGAGSFVKTAKTII